MFSADVYPDTVENPESATKGVVINGAVDEGRRSSGIDDGAG